MATAVRSDDWNQPRCWSLPSRYISQGQDRPKFSFSTDMWDTPLSNHTSRMFLSFSTLWLPQWSHTALSPNRDSRLSLHQMEVPSGASFTFSASKRIRSGVRVKAPQSLQRSAGTGTPHTLWRLMHQSDRLLTML